jgi:hypothetical protein
VEADGDLDELRSLFGLPRLPVTLAVRSKRGLHHYYRPPEGRSPVKVQLDESGVTCSSDGYLVGAGALHPSAGIIYRYLDPDAEIETMPAGIYDLLVALGEQTQERVARSFETGEQIPEGQRSETIFHIALELVRAGKPRAEILDRLLQVNREQCQPPLDESLVEKQIKGAVTWARRNPTEQERLRDQAREVLRGHRQRGAEGEPRKQRSGLFLPFTDVQLSGPPKWLWRGRIPEGAVTLVAGRPKLGKSLFGIWLAAQLSRGLLEGSYHEQPARTLIIAAEDPPDPIVKGRLIAAAADQALVGTLATIKAAKTANTAPGGDLGGLGGLDGLGAYARRITIPDEYALLEEIVVENAVALVVLDPINSFITAKVDAHRDVEIRRVLDPLAALSARRKFASVAVVHLNRRTDTDILNRITGSGGYGGSARSILTFGRHPENEDQRVVAAEGNWQKQAQSDLFELREVIVFPTAASDEQTQPALVHVGGSELDSSDLIDQMAEDGSALEDAREFLLGELIGGPVPVSALRRGAEANAISWRTVERAKKLLGVEARRISGAGAPRGAGRWEWFLEINDPEQSE